MKRIEFSYRNYLQKLVPLEKQKINKDFVPIKQLSCSNSPVNEEWGDSSIIEYHFS